MTFLYISNKSNVRELLSYSSFSDTYNRFFSHITSIRFGWPRDHFALKLQSVLYAPEKFRDFREKGPGLQAPPIEADSPPLCLLLKDFRSFSLFLQKLFNGSFQNLSFLQERAHKDSENKKVWLMLSCACALWRTLLQGIETSFSWL